MKNLVLRGLRGIAALSIGVICFAATPATAQSVAPPAAESISDEQVRRIVERAMAAVSLAEAEADKRIAELQIQLISLQQDLSEEREASDSAVLRRAELEQRADTLAAEVTSLTKEIGELRTENEKLTAREAGLKSEFDTALQSLTIRLNTAVAEKNELQERINSLHTRIGLLERQIGDHEEQRKRLSETWADSVAAVRLENSESEAELARLRSEKNELADQNAELKSRLAGEIAAGTEQESLRMSLESARDENRELREKMAALRDAVHDSAASLSALRQELETVRSTKRELEGALQKNYDRIADISSRTEVLEAENADLAATQSELTEALMASRHEIALALAAIEKSEETITSLREERDRSLAMRESPESKDHSLLLNQLRAENRSYRAEIDALREILFSVQEEARVVTEPPAPPVVEITPAPETAPVRKVVPPAVEPADHTHPAQVEPVDAPSPESKGGSFWNNASYETLAGFESLDEAKVRAIIWYRTNIGSILSTEDLKFVPGFNDETIEALRNELEE